VTDAQYAKIAAAGEGKKAEETTFKPLFRDPIPGEKAYLAPQPTMFDPASSLMRLAVADASAPAVFQEWQGATETSRNAVLRVLESKKAIFVSPLNTEVKVQKVFPEKLINGIYPVQVELASGVFKGKVGWVPVTVVSPVPGLSGKPAEVEAEEHRAERQKTIDRRNQKHQQRLNYQATVSAELAAKAQKEREQQRLDFQVQSQLQLQMLHQQAAVSEARAANARANAYQQMAQSIRQHQIQDAWTNGSGVMFGPGGAMGTVESFRDSDH
jgi:hypothetical protein